MSGLRSALVVIAWLAPYANGQEVATSTLHHEQVRQSARRILDDPLYQGFEHLGDPRTFSPQAHRPPGEAVDPFPTLRRSGSGDRSSRSSAEGGTGRTDGPSSSSRSGEREAVRGPGDDADERDPKASTGPHPGRLGDLPSLRGRDGVERPVRYAPRVRESTPSDAGESWEWDWGENSGLGFLGDLLGTLLHGAAYAILAAIVLLIVLLAVRALTCAWQPRRPRAAMPQASSTILGEDHSPGEFPADQYRERALQLANEGDHRAALGQLVLGAMSSVERAGWIIFRRGLTLHDYLRSVRPLEGVSRNLKLVMATYEPVEYGRRTAGSQEFDQALSSYDAAFQQPLPNRSPRVGP